MRINPKTIELDQLERAVLLAALESRADAIGRSIARRRMSAYRNTPKAIAEVDELERELARVEELHETLTKQQES